jgi:hypothetical protein
MDVVKLTDSTDATAVVCPTLTPPTDVKKGIVLRNCLDV